MSVSDTRRAWAKLYPVVILMAAISVLFPAGAFAQTLEVVPVELVGIEESPEAPPIWFSEGEVVDMSFVALLRVEDPETPGEEQILDVTQIASWTVVSGDQIVQILAPGQLRVVSAGRCLVRVELIGLTADIPITMSDFDAGGSSRELRSDPLPAPVPIASLYWGANSILQQIGSLGVPGTESLSSTFSGVLLVDSVAFAHPILGRFDWVEFNDAAGQFLSEGLHGNEAGISLNWRWTWVRQPTIVLKHEHAVYIAAGGGVHEGGLSDAVSALIHELVHAKIHENGWLIDEDPEEEVVKAIEAIYVRLVVLAQIVANQPLTWNDRYQLRQQLLAIRNHLATLRQVGVDWGLEAIIEELLRQFDIEDDDGNGLPDFIDDLLEDLGINEEDLPTTPQPEESGGGCGEITPLGSGRGPGPSVHPGEFDLGMDPCGNLFRLIAEPDGSIIAVKLAG